MTSTEWDQYWAAADAAGRVAVRPHSVRAHTRAPRKTVTKSKRHTSHTFHLIMTILTGGLWLPVWIYMSAQNAMIKEKSVSKTR